MTRLSKIRLLGRVNHIRVSPLEQWRISESSPLYVLWIQTVSQGRVVENPDPKSNLGGEDHGQVLLGGCPLPLRGAPT